MKTSKVFKTVASVVLALAMVLTTVLGQSSAADAAKKPVLNKTTVKVCAGEQQKVVVKNYVKGSEYVWTSSNAKVATVTPDAKPLKAYVKGVKAGSTTVKCKVTTPDGKKYNLKTKVTVQALPKKITVSAEAKTVGIKATLQLKVTASPKNAYQKITWKSSNTKVAKVDSKGKVTGVKKGSVKITATSSNGKKSTISLKVEAASGKVIWDQNNNKQKIPASYVRKYSEYKYHVSAIWLTPVNLFYSGASKDVGGKVDYLGKTIRISGEMTMAGPDAAEVIGQLNYTRPKAYPVIWKQANVKSGQKIKVDFKFKLPTNAVNGDCDSDGNNWPILFYFANKPNNKMIYKAGNDFTFKNFKFEILD